MVTPAARREAVAHLCEAHQVSQRQACAALGTDRSSVRYRSVRPDEARAKINAWKEDYNRNRPHSSLGNLTPEEFAIKSRLEMKAA